MDTMKRKRGRPRKARADIGGPLSWPIRVHQTVMERIVHDHGSGKAYIRACLFRDGYLSLTPCTACGVPPVEAAPESPNGVEVAQPTF